MPDTADHSGRHEIHIGLRVTDEPGYQRYREGMTPILESMGGFFRYDMRVSDLLRGDSAEPFNRVFIISFPNAQTKERFFDDPGYKAVRAEHFDSSVGSVTLIAEYSLARATT